MKAENAEICRRLRSQLGKLHDITRIVMRIKKVGAEVRDLRPPRSRDKAKRPKASVSSSRGKDRPAPAPERIVILTPPDTCIYR